jgi:hypothetical protein
MDSDRRTVRKLVIAMVVCIVLSCLCVGFTALMAQKNSDGWCVVISTLDDGYRDSPPVSDTGREQASRVRAARIRLGCS